MINVRDFRIGWRLLVKEPAYSAVVILGLTVGFAVCFLLLGYVRHSFSYDRNVPEVDSVYRLKQRWNTPGSNGSWSDRASLPARDAVLAAGVPLLVSSFIEHKVDMKVGTSVQTVSVTAVDPDFQKIFKLHVLAGDIDAALTRPDALALTRETAIKLFFTPDAAGKTVQIDGLPYLVAAVVADQPSTSTLPFAALTGTVTRTWNEEYRKLVTTNWGSSHGPVYIKLLPGASAAPVADSVKRALLASAFFKRMTPDQLTTLGGKDPIEFKLGPLREAYLDPEIRATSITAPHGERSAILGLAAVAILILLLAATNYVNLATVRTLRRQREIAVRKVLGAGAGAVSRQFLAESVLVCLIATALGLIVAWLLLPVFADLVQRTLDDMFTPGALLVSALLGGAVGLAAGAYPTYSALAVRASSALSGRGNAETAGGLWLRRVLTVLQFATAMGLTGLTLAVAWQTRYASSLDPGFDAAPLLNVTTAKDMRDANVRAFRDALQRLPGVSGVAESDAAITFNFNSTNLKRDGGSVIEIPFFLVSPEFFEVHGLKPLAGRLYAAQTEKLSDEDKVVINEAALKKLGFDGVQQAVGKFVTFGGTTDKPMQVIGVAPNIRHLSAREAMEPKVYLLDDHINVFTVRSEANMEAVQKAIEEMWPRFFPNDVLNMKRVASQFAMNYADDLRMAKLLGASSVIAIAIAAFGIYVLAAYSVQRRTREIVLRKLYGASAGAIGRLVAREFAVLIGAGALIGLPIAYVATARYLAAFTERAPIGLWAVSAALAVALVVALASTLRHTIAAVHIAPALALRD